MQMKSLVALAILELVSYGSHSFAQIACPATPTYENCEDMDYSCSGRNSTIRNNYNSQMSVCQRGSQIQGQNPTSTGIPVPRAPVMQNCVVEGVTNTSCIASNQAAQQNYQTQMDNYNHVKAQEAEAQKAAAAQQAYNSAMEAARSAQSANEGGAKKFDLASMLCTVASVALMPPCATPGGQAACVGVAAFAVFSGMAGAQSSSHSAVQNDACKAANQISSSPTNCGAPPSPFQPSQWPMNTVTPLTQNFDPTGKCITTPAACAQITDLLPPGTNIKDTMRGLSSFAGGKGPFKLNADGSITMKNGKTYTAADFANEKAMIAAGMSPAAAAALMAELNKQKSLTDLDAKSALAKENDSSGLGADAAGGAAAAAKGAGDGSGNGDANGLGKDAGGGKRGLASAEGLSKDFNGELIGVAGDDIFKMMNRRYKLKSDQDSFINGMKP